MRALRLALAVLAGAVGCRQQPAAGGDTPPASGAAAPTSKLETRLEAAGLDARTLDADASGNGEAYALVEVRTPEGTFHVQWADLRRVLVEQVLGDTVRAPEAPGAFHPTAPSPAFAMMAADSVVKRARSEADGELLAVMNGAFFETPGRTSTQLAFPVASGGTVVTGGSSPNGPGRPGASGRRWDQPLRVLALGTPAAHIAHYDHASGAPLGAPPFAGAVVSYAPEAHPTRLATRFHVLGPLDTSGDGTTETLVLVTNDGATTLTQTAAVLDALGVAPEARIALDGGASVFVWNRAAGVLHRPTGNQPLPHFLTLRLR